jgi:hypothetical protein
MSIVDDFGGTQEFELFDSMSRSLVSSMLVLFYTNACVLV